VESARESILRGRSSGSSGFGCRADSRGHGKLVREAYIRMARTAHVCKAPNALPRAFQNDPPLFALINRRKKGYRRPLQKEDLWHYDDPRLAAPLAAKLQTNIDKRIAKGKGESKYMLLFALIETFFWQFWFAGFLQVSRSFCFVLTPVFRSCPRHMFPAHHEKLDQLCRRSVRGTPRWNPRTKSFAGNAVGNCVNSNASHLQFGRPSLHVQLHDGRRSVPSSLDEPCLPQVACSVE
jgi:hypothetical protein